MAVDMSEEPSAKTPQNFIRQIVAKDVAAGRHPTIVTRFPPERAQESALFFRPTVFMIDDDMIYRKFL